MLRSDDIDVRSGSDWCHTALKTRFWWACTDCEGFRPSYLISKIWIMGSAEPDVMYRPSGDHAWLIRADWDSLVSCFHPKAWISVCLSRTSNNRSCLPGSLRNANRASIGQEKERICITDRIHSNWLTRNYTAWSQNPHLGASSKMILFGSCLSSKMVFSNSMLNQHTKGQSKELKPTTTRDKFSDHIFWVYRVLFTWN